MNDLVQRHFTGRGFGVEFEMEANWVRRHLRGRRGAFVEVGCGIGALLGSLDTRGAIGVDHNAEGLACTSERLAGVPLICASADRLPFSRESLDAIAAQHLIEHLSACETACEEWFRALKPGGVLLLLTPNRLFCDLSVFDDDTHVELFDHKTLGDILARAGFEIMDMRSLGLPWFRKYHGIPSGWRLRRAVTRHAETLSRLGGWRWKGQTLACIARRPTS